MSTHQARSAQRRQVVRSVLAQLRGVQPSSLRYPRSNALLQEYQQQINRIRVTDEEFIRLGNIDPHPHYEINFERREQVRIGGEITDSNYIADIAIDTPGEHDCEVFLDANRDVIIQ